MGLPNIGEKLKVFWLLKGVVTVTPIPASTFNRHSDRLLRTWRLWPWSHSKEHNLFWLETTKLYCTGQARGPECDWCKMEKMEGPFPRCSGLSQTWCTFAPMTTNQYTGQRAPSRLFPIFKGKLWSGLCPCTIKIVSLFLPEYKYPPGEWGEGWSHDSHSSVGFKTHNAPPQGYISSVQLLLKRSYAERAGRRFWTSCTEL